MRSNRAPADREVAECYTPGHPRPEKPRLANAPLPDPGAPRARRVLGGDAHARGNRNANFRGNAYPNPYSCPHSHSNVNADSNDYCDSDRDAFALPDAGAHPHSHPFLHRHRRPDLVEFRFTFDDGAEGWTVGVR